MNEQALERAMEAFRIEQETLRATAETLDPEQLMKAAEVLAKAERIGTSGCGHTGMACRHFAHLMCCIERPARFISPAEAVHGAMGYIQEGDVMLLASRGGKTDELIPIAEICRKKKAILITVTENTDSPLAEMADIVLTMKITRECDRFNTQGTASFAATNAIFDALQTAVAELVSFTPDTFAVVHPHGAVGKRLNGNG